MSHKKVPVAVLISGTGNNLQAIINAQKDFNYQVSLVISNRPNAEGIEKAKKAGVQTLVIDHSKYKTRQDFDTELHQAIKQHKIKTVVLAGFMRILSPEFTTFFLGNMLNIHPSLLPKYPGLNTHQKVIENQDQNHGLSIHFVTAELDGGPIILQAKFSVKKDETAQTLKQHTQQLEHQAYPQVIDWLVTNKLALKNNQAYLNNQLISDPLEFC